MTIATEGICFLAAVVVIGVVFLYRLAYWRGYKNGYDDCDMYTFEQGWQPPRGPMVDLFDPEQDQDEKGTNP